MLFLKSTYVFDCVTGCVLGLGIDQREERIGGQIQNKIYEAKVGEKKKDLECLHGRTFF